MNWKKNLSGIFGSVMIKNHDVRYYQQESLKLAGQKAAQFIIARMQLISKAEAAITLPKPEDTPDTPEV